jgi:DNA replication protein DnaC
MTDSTSTTSDDRVRRYLLEDGVPLRLVDSTFENFERDDRLTRALSAAVNWAVASPNEAGLWLQGPPGTGKTHLVVAALRHRVETRDGYLSRQPWDIHPPHFRVVPILLHQLRRAMDYRDARIEEEFDHLMSCPHPVVLDDLGREKSSEWVTERLYALVESRYGNMVPTVATTNLSGAELAANGYDAIVSRLRQSGYAAKTDGADHRLGMAPAMATGDSREGGTSRRRPVMAERREGTGQSGTTPATPATPGSGTGQTRTGTTPATPATPAPRDNPNTGRGNSGQQPADKGQANNS